MPGSGVSFLPLVACLNSPYSLSIVCWLGASGTFLMASAAASNSFPTSTDGVVMNVRAQGAARRAILDAASIAGAREECRRERWGAGCPLSEVSAAAAPAPPTARSQRHTQQAAARCNPPASNEPDPRAARRGDAAAMPSVIKVHVRGARNLPAMNARTGKADAYPVLTFGDQQQRQAPVLSSRAPVFDWTTRIEVDNDNDLQSTPLSVTIVHKDRMTSDEVIGTVVLSLEPLLSHSHGWASEIDGWIPLHDTLRGLRGEVDVQVRVSHGMVGDGAQDGMMGAMAGVPAMSEGEVQFYAISRLSMR